MPDEDYLKEVFSKYGKIIYIKCFRIDRNKGRKSYALIEYLSLVRILSCCLLYQRKMPNMQEGRCTSMIIEIEEAGEIEDGR